LKSRPAIDQGRLRCEPSQCGASREDWFDNLLRLEDASYQDVVELGPNEVLVRVKSAAVSFINLLMLSGQYQTMLPLPCVLGMEYSGVVAAV
jgi:NADPH2:quinone reductase